MAIPRGYSKEISEIVTLEDLDGSNIQGICFKLIEEIKKLKKKINYLENRPVRNYYSGDNIE